MNISTCYCCDAEATSQEHAPPKCIFPVLKDSGGRDYRKNLIKVPSCDIHNTAKSKDDEYLLSVLALNIVNNQQGNDQATTKVLRAVKRSGGLAKALLKDVTPLIVQDLETKQTEETVGIRVDEERIKSALKQIALAIYYHHYDEKFDGLITCYYESLMTLDGDNPVKTNQHWENFRELSNELFADLPEHGENPDIFSYQIREDQEISKPLAMRLKFYGKNNCTVIFKTA